MKNYFLISFVSICFVNQIFGQNPIQITEPFHAYTKEKYRYNNVDSTALKYGLDNYKTINCNYNKKGKTSYSIDQVFFDKYGRLQQVIKYDDTMKQLITQQQIVIYNNQHLATSEFYQYGKSGYKTISSYNDSNRLLQRSVFNLKNKLNYVTNYSYNELGLLNSQTNYNSKLRERYQYEYSYFPNKKLKQSILRQGKKTKVWDYTCDETGELQKKAKDTIKICTQKSYQADGSIVSITTGYTWNGKPYKSIHITDSFSNTLSYKYFEDIKEELIYSILNKYENNKLVHYEYEHYKKANISYQSIIKYDNQGRIISSTQTSYFKKKSTFTSLYEYNNLGFIINKKTLHNNRLIKSQTYHYQYTK
jgi:hypothetical protein